MLTDLIFASPGVRSRTLVVAAYPAGKFNSATIVLSLMWEVIEKPTRPQRVGTSVTAVVFPSASHSRGIAFPSHRVSDSGSSKTSSQRVINETTSCAGVQYGAAALPVITF